MDLSIVVWEGITLIDVRIVFRFIIYIIVGVFIDFIGGVLWIVGICSVDYLI